MNEEDGLAASFGDAEECEDVAILGGHFVLLDGVAALLDYFWLENYTVT